MPRSIRSYITAGVVIASIWSADAKAAQAQQAQQAAAAKPDAQATVVARDSVTIADVQKAADQLAVAVQDAVRKATEDPALKLAALKVAKNAVSAAQIVISQQAETLEKVLAGLAREIAQASDKHQARQQEKQQKKDLTKPHSH